MKKKICIGIIFGGKSAEHDVSRQSAKKVFESLDRAKYDPVLIMIQKRGKWILSDSQKFPNQRVNSGRLITFAPQGGGIMIDLGGMRLKQKIDVFFPVLHGPNGEDGTVQGFLKMINVPFVGSDVLGSAIGMDKDITHRLLRDAKIPVAKFLVIKKNQAIDLEKIVGELGLPFFVKPAGLGSSLGVSKVKERKDFASAIDKASEYDNKIVIEENIKGRELECAVLGDDDPVASLPGEVTVGHNFYSYAAKYLNSSNVTLDIPAKLPKKTTHKIRALAVKTFKILACEGLGRVDFFLKDNGEILVNEINTIPGFTPASMYPKLWAVTGIPFSQVIDRLVQLALTRFKKEQELTKQ